MSGTPSAWSLVRGVSVLMAVTAALSCGSVIEPVVSQSLLDLCEGKSVSLEFRFRIAGADSGFPMASGTSTFSTIVFTPDVASRSGNATCEVSGSVTSASSLPFAGWANVAQPVTFTVVASTELPEPRVLLESSTPGPQDGYFFADIRMDARNGSWSIRHPDGLRGWGGMSRHPGSN